MCLNMLLKTWMVLIFSLILEFASSSLYVKVKMTLNLVLWFLKVETPYEPIMQQSRVVSARVTSPRQCRPVTRAVK